MQLSKPLSCCPRGYQDAEGAPATLPPACARYCPVALGVIVPERWWSAVRASREGGPAAGYTPRALAAAADRGRLFRNPLHVEKREGRVVLAGLPECGLVAYREMRRIEADGRGQPPPSERKRIGKKRAAKKAERAEKSARFREKRTRIQIAALFQGLRFADTRARAVALLRDRKRLKITEADIARELRVTRQRIHTIKQEEGL